MSCAESRLNLARSQMPRRTQAKTRDTISSRFCEEILLSQSAERNDFEPSLPRIVLSCSMTTRHLAGQRLSASATHWRQAGHCRASVIMANVAVEDLSGTSIPVTANPYDGLINASHGDPVSYMLPTLIDATDYFFRNCYKRGTLPTGLRGMRNRRTKSLAMTSKAGFLTSILSNLMAHRRMLHI